jgi:hypothetical protein
MPSRSSKNILLVLKKCELCLRACASQFRTEGTSCVAVAYSWLVRLTCSGKSLPYAAHRFTALIQSCRTTLSGLRRPRAPLGFT